MDRLFSSSARTRYRIAAGGALAVAAVSGIAAFGAPGAGATGWGSKPTTTVSAATKTVNLHKNDVGAQNPGWGHANRACPQAPAGKPYGYHFELAGKGSKFVSISVQFEKEGTVTAWQPRGTSGTHGYVYVSGPDKLLGASAVITGDEVDFGLTRVCNPESTIPDECNEETPGTTKPHHTKPSTTTTRRSTTTSTAAPTTTSTAAPTTTTTVAPTTTSTAAPTTTTTVAPTTTSTAAPTTTSTVAPTTTSTTLPTTTTTEDEEPTTTTTAPTTTTSEVLGTSTSRGSTTTTVASTTTTEAEDTTTTTDAVSPETLLPTTSTTSAVQAETLLPATGNTTLPLVVFGASLLAAGFFLLRSTRAAA